MNTQEMFEKYIKETYNVKPSAIVTQLTQHAYLAAHYSQQSIIDEQGKVIAYKDAVIEQRNLEMTYHYDEAKKLQKVIDEQALIISRYNAAHTGLAKTVDDQREEITRLREALELIATKTWIVEHRPANEMQGIARQALNK